MRATGINLLIRVFFHDASFGGNRGEKQGKPEVRRFRDKGFGSGENQLKEVTWREAELAATLGAKDVGRGPREGVAFEVEDSHVRRDFPTDPTAKDGRGNTGCATSFNRGEVASNRGGSHIRAFTSRGGNTHTAEELCVCKTSSA